MSNQQSAADVPVTDADRAVVREYHQQPFRKGEDSNKQLARLVAERVHAAETPLREEIERLTKERDDYMHLCSLNGMSELQSERDRLAAEVERLEKHSHEMFVKFEKEHESSSQAVRENGELRAKCERYEKSFHKAVDALYEGPPLEAVVIDEAVGPVAAVATPTSRATDGGVSDWEKEVDERFYVYGGLLYVRTHNKSGAPGSRQAQPFDIKEFVRATISEREQRIGELERERDAAKDALQVVSEECANKTIKHEKETARFHQALRDEWKKYDALAAELKELKSRPQYALPAGSFVPVGMKHAQPGEWFHNGSDRHPTITKNYDNIETTLQYECYRQLPDAPSGFLLLKVGSDTSSKKVFDVIPLNPAPPAAVEGEDDGFEAWKANFCPNAPVEAARALWPYWKSGIENS